MEQLTIEKQGFDGMFFPCINAFDEKKAVIVIGGKEGESMLPRTVGAMFSMRGIAALGVCFFDEPGLPECQMGVSIEPIERAVEWLLSRGFERIALYGFSKGAELSLFCASVIPEITGVIGVSPMHCIFGRWAKKTMKAGKTIKTEEMAEKTAISEFTYHGKQLPCMVAEPDYKSIIRHWIFEQQMKLADMYDCCMRQFREETAISVENIQGDILLIYAMEDTIWCSARAVEYIRERLKQYQFTHSFTELSYDKASHILVPIHSPSLKMFRMERRFPEECLNNRLDAFERTIGWLKAW